jgi:hypothetical protein
MLTACYPLGTQGSFSRANWPQHETNHQSPSSDDIKNGLYINSHTHFHGVVLKHRDNYTFQNINLQEIIKCGMKGIIQHGIPSSSNNLKGSYAQKVTVTWS